MNEQLNLSVFYAFNKWFAKTFQQSYIDQRERLINTSDPTQISITGKYTFKY